MNRWRHLIARLNRVGNEDHRAVGHQDVTTALVIATWRHHTSAVIAAMHTDFPVRWQYFTDRELYWYGTLGASSKAQDPRGHRRENRRIERRLKS